MKVVIVDGYSTGAALVRRLAEAGVECVHVQSHPDLRPFFLRAFRPADYVLDLGFTDDTTALVTQLRRHHVSLVLAGTESGVLLAETLAHALGLPTNEPELLHARRDKALMAEAARAAGLATPRSTVVRSPRAAADWFAASGLAEAVVKPLASAGTDGVTFCHSPEETARAGHAILSSPNAFGEPNHSVLVQERVHGDEYYINTVSSAGVHHTAEIWRYTKRLGPAGTPIYDFEEPVAPASAEGQVLMSFVGKVLDGLGIAETPAHTEVMLTSDGPVLIETGARLGGATAPDVVDTYLGTSQTSLAVAAITDPPSLRSHRPADASGGHRLRCVEFINHHRGIAAAEALTKISELPSVVSASPAADPGTLLEPTTDLLTSPGYAYLAAPSLTELTRDYETLRAWEHEGIYTE
ncbi:ATP-grasp domain-containing protein [Streptomyces milbemycinicus]|uniref:ATP-grasp domain-containing protein n=1 Tax=Streptomyces milbemycinicus TaxID=476552 RepID=UPI0033D7998D